MVLPHPMQRNLRQLMLVRVADDETHARQRRDLFRSALRVASGDYNLCVWILSPHAPDGGARILIRCGRDGASIQNHDCSLRVHGGTRDAALLELAFESSAVRLGGAATEVLYVISRHVSMLAHGTNATPPPRTNVPTAPPAQAEAAVLRDIKHSRQKTGRPWVGRKGTVVCFPHPEQVAWVSTLV